MSKVFLVALGQSNSIFYGHTPWPLPGNTTAPGAVLYNYLNDQFTPAADPLPGFATPGPGYGGSIWTRLLYLLSIEPAGPRRPWPEMVCIAPIGHASASSAVWRQDGPSFSRIAQVRAAAANIGMQIGGYLWMNGETDGADLSMPYGQHTANVQNLVEGIRLAGDNAPFFAAQCTTCRNGVGPSFELLDGPTRTAKIKRLASLRLEQSRLPYELAWANVRRGPDLDVIAPTPPSRWDGCHLGDVGQFVAAEMWRETLLDSSAAGVI